MIESCDDGKADDVDADAIVLDVGRVIPLAVAHRRPERPPRLRDDAEQRVVQRKRARVRRVERSAPPPVHDELHRAPRRSFGRQRVGRTNQLVVGVARRDERQRLVVEHDVDDDRSAGGGVGVRLADAAPGMEQAALFGSEQRRFLENLPVAARLAPALRRRDIVGKVQREPRREPALRRRRARVTKRGARWRGWCSPTFRTRCSTRPAARAPAPQGSESRARRSAAARSAAWPAARAADLWPGARTLLRSVGAGRDRRNGAPTGTARTRESAAPARRRKDAAPARHGGSAAAPTPSPTRAPGRRARRRRSAAPALLTAPRR